MAITVAMNKIYKDGIRIKEIIFDWTTAAAASTATCMIGYELYSAGLQKASFISGKIFSLETMPGLNGVADRTLSSLPEPNWDVYLYDSYNCDLLSANGENRASATAQIIAYTTPLFVDDELQLSIMHASDVRSGRIALYVEE